MTRTGLLLLTAFGLACGPGGAPGASDAGTTTTDATGSGESGDLPTGSPTSTGTTSTGAASTGEAASTAGTGTTEPFDLCGCAADEICVVGSSSDIGFIECRPNPDGCVPSTPCSPECAAICGEGKACSDNDGDLGCSDPNLCEAEEFFEPCVDGQKCNLADVLDEGGWTGTDCVPLDPDPDEPGEPCTVMGDAYSGVDSCAAGSTCWDVDPETLQGICRAHCWGQCGDPGTICVYTAYYFQFCLPTCDPLAQDCPNGSGCYGFTDGFLCTFDASGADGGFGDPCQYPSACDPGYHCVDSSDVPGCMDMGCCSPLCDTTAPNSCPAPEQVCMPYYMPGEAPSGDEDVGFCGVL